MDTEHLLPRAECIMKLKMLQEMIEQIDDYVNKDFKKHHSDVPTIMKITYAFVPFVFKASNANKLFNYLVAVLCIIVFTLLLIRLLRLVVMGQKIQANWRKSFWRKFLVFAALGFYFCCSALLVCLIVFDCAQTKYVLKQYLVNSNYDKLLRSPLPQKL